MTDREKQYELGVRVARLSDIRSELTVSRKQRDVALKNLRLAGGDRQNVDDYSRNPPRDEEWPSPREIRDLEKTVSDLEGEARIIISELRNLGVDGGLFKLNGD